MAADHPAKLVKHCSTATAMRILTTQALRWSAPHLSSDPFELNHQSQLTFDPHILLQSAINAATAMIFAKDAPRGSTPLPAAIRRWREEERFASPEEADEVLKELLSQMVDHRQLQIDKTMTDWRRFTRNLRICSFSSKPDNLTAWQHYADGHRGVGLRFESGENTSLEKPMMVEYKTVRPEITSLKQQLNAIMQGEKVTPQDHFYENLLTKPMFSRDEQEWRCFHNVPEDLSSDSSDSSQWFIDRKFERAELSGVYFGAFTSAKDKRDIYDLVKEKYKQAQVFQAKVVSGKYEIEFVKVGKK